MLLTTEPSLQKDCFLNRSSKKLFCFNCQAPVEVPFLWVALGSSVPELSCRDCGHSLMRQAGIFSKGRVHITNRAWGMGWGTCFSTQVHALLRFAENLKAKRKGLEICFLFPIAVCWQCKTLLSETSIFFPRLCSSKEIAEFINTS